MHMIEPRRSASWRLTITSMSTMSERWEAVSATQITLSGATPTGALATQVADHIGGYLRACADQRLLRTVTRFQARHRAERRL